MRSLLFVPGDSERKLDRASGARADALVVDLEDAVAPDAKQAARERAAAFLAQARARTPRPRLFVRINALDTPFADDDIDAIVAARPDGLMLPKAGRGADVMLLDAKISTAEALAGVEDGATRVIAIACETAASIFDMGSFARASARLEGLAWGAEDLSADVGATSNRDAGGDLTELYQLARALCLAASAAAGVAAIETVYPDFRDIDGLARDCARAARDGFSGRLAIHPAQVPVINEAFAPSDAAIAQAQAVLDAVATAGAGVASLDGRMLDAAHVRRAHRLLARSRPAGRLPDGRG